VIAFAVLTGPVPKLGVVLVSLLAAVVLVARDGRARALAMLGALILSPLLLLATISSSKLSIVHRHPLEAAALGVIAVVVVVALAFVFDRHPSLFAMLAVAALPFRIPISSGGTTNDLLVPLYLVVGAGVLAFVARKLRGEPALGSNADRPSGWLERLLALYVVLYGIQATYSPGAVGPLPSGFQAALQNMVFFYVPFALLFRLLLGLEWNGELIRRCVQVAAVVALACAAVALFEYATKHTYFSTRLADQNQLYTYFVANSVFRDPNIFARFIALVMIVLSVVLLYGRPRREQAVVGGVLVILWLALVISFSRSSMLALLVGLALLAANKWRPTRALVAVAVVVVVGAAAVAISPNTFGVNQGLNGVSAGRGSVVKGGLKLFGRRPVWGLGSGSFEHEYGRYYTPRGSTLTASHTIPVTIAAEQGVIGELAYLALVLVAIVALLRGSSADPARAGVAAAFIALLVHTMLYADFLEDPFTWVLLAVGMALARSSRPVHEQATVPPAAVAPVPA
jgi:putative inorganic carbon (hco3(-)) transporter